MLLDEERRSQFLVIRDDGSSELFVMTETEAVSARNDLEGVIRVRRMSLAAVEMHHACREHHVLMDETPDCRTCRNLWADRTMSGKRFPRPDRGP
jgi:hypothetical protein